MAGILPYLQEEIEIFLNETNEVEHLRMEFGEVLGPHESKLPEYLEYDDFVKWKGNKKTLKGLNDNKFGDHLFLGTDKNRVRFPEQRSQQLDDRQAATETGPAAKEAHEAKLQKEMYLLRPRPKEVKVNNWEEECNKGCRCSHGGEGTGSGT